MAFKTCIKIRNKSGFNIEKKLDLVLSRYGYHIVRNPEHFERSLFLYTDDSKWLTVASDDLDNAEFAIRQKLAAEISESFRTLTSIEPFRLPATASSHEFHFSACHSAFDEPPFIQEGSTCLKWHMYGLSCESGAPFMLTFINTGGISKGLELFITGDFVDNDSATFDPLYIHATDYKNKDKNRLSFQTTQQKISLNDGSQAYYYDFADFVFPEGINQYSAVLGGGQFGSRCFHRSVYLWMIPTGNQLELDTMQIAIRPKTNTDSVIYWHRRDLSCLQNSPPDFI